MLLLLATAAAADLPHALDFDSAAELDGWEVLEEDVSWRVGDGVLEVGHESETTLLELQRWPEDGGGWWSTVQPDGAWIVEAEVRLGPASCDGASAWLWAHDGARWVIVDIAPGDVSVQPNVRGESLHVAVPEDGAAHRYRVESWGDGWASLWVDGEPALPAFDLEGGEATAVFAFGSKGGCVGQSVWERLAWDAAAPSHAGEDLDGDGLVDDDDCPHHPDPDQTDSDGDGQGDACDRCPLDPENDADGDRVCGDVDPCPYARFDDEDEDGICDDVDNDVELPRGIPLPIQRCGCASGDLPAGGLLGMFAALLVCRRPRHRAWPSAPAAGGGVATGGTTSGSPAGAAASASGPAKLVLQLSSSWDQHAPPAPPRGLRAVRRPRKANGLGG